jgi:hypothetical protein
MVHVVATEFWELTSTVSWKRESHSRNIRAIYCGTAGQTIRGGGRWWSFVRYVTVRVKTHGVFGVCTLQAFRAITGS